MSLGTGLVRPTDLSNDSHSLAFCLHGASQDDDDIYVMINAYWEELEFHVQEGAAQEWTQNRGHSIAKPQRLREIRRSSRNNELPRSAEIGCGAPSAELAG